MSAPLSPDDLAAMVATADLAGRAGAHSFELSWSCPHDVEGSDGDHYCASLVWTASCRYRGARVIGASASSPFVAVVSIAEKLLKGAGCKCGRLVSLSALDPGCRWRLDLLSERWESSCDAPPIFVPGGRGDLAGMNRAARRAARRRRR